MADKIFHTMPFRAESLIKKGPSEKCDLATSVRQNLRLLLMTPTMRVRFDPRYGCKVHHFQFLASNRAMENRKEEDDFKYLMEKNITALIEQFEPRVLLKDVGITIRYAVEDHTKWYLSEGQRIKGSVLQLVVNVKGSVKPEFAFGQELDLEDTIALL
jgi:phage baseplate assembly protein W